MKFFFDPDDPVNAYLPLEGNKPWTWLVSIPISRELQASLMIRAADGRWPVGSISIAVVAQPTP